MRKNWKQLNVLSSVQFSRAVLSDSLRPHESQHTRPPCPSPTPGVHPNPCPLHRWCHSTLSSSVSPFSSCLQSFPASQSFPVSWLWKKSTEQILPCDPQKEPTPLIPWFQTASLQNCEKISHVHAQSLSHVWLFGAPWTIASQASLSMGFSKQEYWSGLPFPAPGDLPNPGIKSCISHIGRQILYLCTTWEVHETVNVCCLSCSVGGTVLQEFKRIHRTGISGIHIPSVVCSTSDLASKSWAW